MTDNTDSLHTQLTNTVPCTRCGVNEVPAPSSIEEDPLCPDCKEADMLDRRSHADFLQVAADLKYEAENACRHGDNPDPECDGCYG